MAGTDFHAAIHTNAHWLDNAIWKCHKIVSKITAARRVRLRSFRWYARLCSTPGYISTLEVDKPEPVNVLIVAGTDPLAITAANVLNADLNDDDEDFVVTIVNTRRLHADLRRTL
jgi:hypothetical protein